MKHKKTLFSMLLLSLVLATPLCSNAQSALDKFHLELGFGTGTPKDKMTPFGASVDLNYSLTPVVGAGYSFQDFRTKGLNNYNGLYVSIGCRFW